MPPTEAAQCPLAPARRRLIIRRRLRRESLRVAVPRVDDARVPEGVAVGAGIECQQVIVGSRRTPCRRRRDAPVERSAANLEWPEIVVTSQRRSPVCSVDRPDHIFCGRPRRDVHHAMTRSGLSRKLAVHSRLNERHRESPKTKINAKIVEHKNKKKNKKKRKKNKSSHTYKHIPSPPLPKTKP